MREVGAFATVTVDHRSCFGQACGDGYTVVSAGSLTVSPGCCTGSGRRTGPHRVPQPHSALVIFAAVRLVELSEFRRIATFRSNELATTAGVLLLDVLYGVLVAIGLSIVDQLHDGILGEVPGIDGMHDVNFRHRALAAVEDSAVDALDDLRAEHCSAVAGHRPVTAFARCAHRWKAATAVGGVGNRRPHCRESTDRVLSQRHDVAPDMPVAHVASIFFSDSAPVPGGSPSSG